MGKSIFEFSFEPEPCINITITVIELDPETQKCDQGLCSGLDNISIKTKAMVTAFTDKCDEKEEVQLKKRW